MRGWTERILPKEQKQRKWIAIGITVVTAGLLTLWGVNGIGEYGAALFLLTPIFIGAGSTILYGLDRTVTRQDARHISFLTLGIFMLGLLAFAIEGLICIAMVIPFALLFTWIGSELGYRIVNKYSDKAPSTFLLLIAIIPLTAFTEKGSKPVLLAVSTAIQIDAPPQTVWNNVVQFPELGEPDEFLFKTGIAYPINARIDGHGVGAVRHCSFTTGSFVEPVTVWNEPQLLRFDVVEQPAPMKELSLWDVNAPHLHDYFVSKQGQFKLVALPDGKTRLEGTTWYYHNIKPTFYWQMWSSYIIHKIHNRVLSHIKQLSEKPASKMG